jgi:hypothetical protein
MARLRYVEFGDNGFETKEAEAPNELTRDEVWTMVTDLAAEVEHMAVAAFYEQAEPEERLELFGFLSNESSEGEEPIDRQMKERFEDMYSRMLNGGAVLMSGVDRRTGNEVPVICTVEAPAADGSGGAIHPVAFMLRGATDEQVGLDEDSVEQILEIALQRKISAGKGTAQILGDGGMKDSALRKAAQGGEGEWLFAGFPKKRMADDIREEIDRLANGVLKTKVYQVENGFWEVAWSGPRDHMEGVMEALQEGYSESVSAPLEH